MYIFGLCVNVLGERFVDEGYDSTENTYSRYGKTALTQPDRVIFQLFDAKGFDILTKGGIFHDYVNAAYTKADTLEEMADKLGIPANNLFKTVSEYNKAAGHPGGNNHWYKFTGRPEDAHTEGLALAKSSCAYALETPPYYAYAVECGITFTYGGLKVNKHAQVLRSGDIPIKGLYASGEITGGIFYQNYAGACGQLTGAVFATIAGKYAVLDQKE
jgi:tricarballylate dehydrogenase